ncbi:MAG: hypothetical protein AVDCRST_MAG76-1250 [uncultured Acidimicrobiales bacterium]|uniref:O-antigen ligase-related domain-containing protein n=1 Tax=uncultured Acidimicrobiales bacterium TaxID=310071 RepID=A0A6J4HU64_9ACTN|nr:MAG: hypothetical protein AVDCRST_MAG76-1250 [uncultured Acidimicrobiales bacterium]
MGALSTLPGGKPTQVENRADPSPTATSLAVALVLALSATTIALANLDSRPGRDFQLHTILLASDLALLALIGIGVGGLRVAIRSWRSHACVLAALALGLSMMPAALVNPSDRGAAALVRWSGAVALGLAVGSARRDGRRLVVGALALVTLAHVSVAFGQRAAGGPIGLDALGEARSHEIGGLYASSGLTVHPYVLAAWCAVAGTALLALQRRRPAAGGLTTVAGIAAFAGIGLTMSRAGALGAALALAVLSLSTRRPRDRRWRAPAAGAAAALALGALVNLSGWISRAGQASGSVDAISSGRGALVRQAWALLRDDLLTGVGPGRYVLALVERPALVELSSQSPRPVHVTPLLLVVEGGLVVVPALILLVLAVVRACRRAGATATAVALAMVPFLALDHLAWSYPQGMVLAGVWLGVIDLLSQRDDADPVEDAQERSGPSGPPEAPA